MDRERQRRVKKRFGKRMRKLRKARGLTQAALARACDLDPSYLGKIERGESNVALVNIHRIAEALEVEAAELFGEA
jgi:transcriptional regulator with XRE-family HTH domain